MQIAKRQSWSWLRPNAKLFSYSWFIRLSLRTFIVKQLLANNNMHADRVCSGIHVDTLADEWAIIIQITVILAHAHDRRNLLTSRISIIAWGSIRIIRKIQINLASHGPKLADEPSKRKIAVLCLTLITCNPFSISIQVYWFLDKQNRFFSSDFCRQISTTSIQLGTWNQMKS